MALYQNGDAEVLTILMTATLKPEHEQEFLDFTTEYERTVTTNEPGGCLLYTVLQEQEPPHTYVLLQRYRNFAAYETHRGKDYRARGVELINKWTAKPAEIRFFRQILPK